MQGTIDFLDPNSEMLALADGDNTKNLLVTAFQIGGPVDEDVARLAVAKVVERYPRLNCSLRDMKTRGRYRLYWHPQPHLEFPVTVSSLEHHEDSAPLLDTVLNHLAPILDRARDLREELPGELHLVGVSDELSVAAIIVHHAAFDAAAASEFGRCCVLQYKQMIERSEEDPVHRQDYALSTSKKRAVTVRMSRWESMLQSARLALMSVMSKPTLPAGSGMPQEKAQYHIKRVLSVEDTARIAVASLKKRGAFIDLLTACSALTIEKWNQGRNVETDSVTTALTMNIRGRYQDSDQPNNVSALFFESRPDDRKQRQSLVHSISMARIKQLRKHMDLNHNNNVARMVGCTSFLPFNARRKIVYSIVRHHQFSMAITLLGVVWPVIEDSKPTLESYPTNIGNIQISEIHGLGYKLIGSTPLMLTVYTYHNRLNLVMATSGWLFNRPEADAFMDLFMEMLTG
jgi:hypothetical protein